MPEKRGVPLQNLLSFFETLNRESVRYCHWKSNLRLENALAGRTDLDLLVDRYHAQRFRDLAGEFGFKEMRSPAYKQYPAMEDYLGFDEATGCLSHLHVHYRLILGKQYMKEYCVPLEESFLASRQYQEPLHVMIPLPEWELVVLIIRVLLKTRNRTLMRALLKHSCPMPMAMQDEIEYLMDQSDPQKLKTVLDTANSVVASGIIVAFLDLWNGGFLAPWRLFRLRYQLLRALGPYRWVSRWRSLRYYLLQELLSQCRRLNKTRKQMMAGGLTIAFVGADGSGKSTIVSEIKQWMNWKLEVQTFYMGSKQPSLRSRLIKALFVNSNRLHRVCVILFGQRNKPSQLTAAIRRFFESLNAAALGMERYRRYRLGYRAARRGQIVLFDRFPLPEVYEFMDGPRSVSSEKGNERKLARIEHYFYRSISGPDATILLHINPKISLARKPHHNPEAVIGKSEAIKNLHGSHDTRITHVDANVTLKEVLLQVKKAVWRLL